MCRHTNMLICRSNYVSIDRWDHWLGVYIYIYICMHACVHVYLYVHVSLYTCISMYKYICVCLSITTDLTIDRHIYRSVCLCRVYMSLDMFTTACRPMCIPCIGRYVYTLVESSAYVCSNVATHTMATYTMCVHLCVHAHMYLSIDCFVGGSTVLVHTGLPLHGSEPSSWSNWRCTIMSNCNYLSSRGMLRCQPGNWQPVAWTSTSIGGPADIPVGRSVQHGRFAQWSIE